MTHDERIEAMARAICDSDYYGAWDECSEEWRCNLRAMATAALAAAGVEEMVRAAAFDGFVQGQSFDGFDNRVGTAATIDDIVREVMGK
jgi:hypothetical protein